MIKLIVVMVVGTVTMVMVIDGVLIDTMMLVTIMGTTMIMSVMMTPIPNARTKLTLIICFAIYIRVNCDGNDDMRTTRMTMVMMMKAIQMLAHNKTASYVLQKL